MMMTTMIIITTTTSSIIIIIVIIIIMIIIILHPYKHIEGTPNASSEPRNWNQVQRPPWDATTVLKKSNMNYSMNTCNPYESITNITQQLSASLSVSLSLFATLGLAVCRYDGKLWTPWKSNEKDLLSDLIPWRYLDVRVFATEAFFLEQAYTWLQLFSSFQVPYLPQNPSTSFCLYKCSILNLKQTWRNARSEQPLIQGVQVFSSLSLSTPQELFSLSPAWQKVTILSGLDKHPMQLFSKR